MLELSWRVVRPFCLCIICVLDAVTFLALVGFSEALELDAENASLWSDQPWLVRARIDSEQPFPLSASSEHKGNEVFENDLNCRPNAKDGSGTTGQHFTFL